jgi:hypothetical protein
MEESRTKNYSKLESICITKNKHRIYNVPNKISPSTLQRYNILNKTSLSKMKRSII